MGDCSTGVHDEKQRSDNEYNMGLLKNTVFIFRSLINYKPTAPDFFDFCLVRTVIRRAQYKAILIIILPKKDKQA